MRSGFLLGFLCCCALGFSSAARADDVKADGAKVYTGNDGLTVTIVWLAPKSNKKAVIKISGADGVFEGKVLPYDDTSENGAMKFTTEWNGRHWSTFQQSKSAWGDMTTEIFLPLHRDGISVYYDDAKTGKVDTGPILDQYKKSLAAGEFKALAAYDRKGDESRNGDALSKDASSTNKTCGSNFDTNVQWSSITDEMMRKYSVASYCGNALSALRSICSDATSKQAVTSQVKHFSCQFGKAMDLTLSSGTLTFTTAIDGTNQTDWAKNVLLKKL